VKATLQKIIAHIVPLDDIERTHIDDVLTWIDSGAELYRITKPDNPSKHLVSYVVLFDQAHGSVMIIDHKKSGLWLPAGGHLEPGEHPRTAVIRETKEELGIEASFETPFGDAPIFITVAQTVRNHQHTDVSLWYVIAGDHREQLNYDTSEINGCRWMRLDEVLTTDTHQLDPHMHRFIEKMQRSLG
jgi:8-oxo-dGTP pyrophosphatase MutT (NUDIX family)